MEHYKTLAGETITYDPSPVEARFLAQVVDLAHDPTATESDMVALIYGSENPMLKHGVLPDRGLVTKETWANPVHQVAMHLLDVKRVATGTLDMKAVRARYTMTVKEAAAKIGMSPTGVRNAVHAGRLTHWRTGRAIYLDPVEVGNYRKAATGPKRRGVKSSGSRPILGHELQVAMGSRPGYSCHMKAPSRLLSDKKVDHRREGPLPAGWQRIAFRFTDKAARQMTYYELIPGDAPAEIEHGPFYVKGRFTIARQLTKPDVVTEVWKAFKAM